SLFGDNLLVLIYEHVFSDVTRAREQIAAHLNLDPSCFTTPQEVNAATLPRFGSLYAAARKCAQWFTAHDMHRVNQFVGRTLGVDNLLTSRNKPVLSEPHLHYAPFAKDVERLEQILDVSLAHWKPMSG
ncbi:MAG TPA: hypothetical protein VF322_14495, partial [Gammaproteobacteria bacterium]